jgi:hypothetical protein
MLRDHGVERPWAKELLEKQLNKVLSEEDLFNFKTLTDLIGRELNQ